MPGRAISAEPPRPNWFQRRVGYCAYQLAGSGDIFCRSWRWLPTAIVVGAAPFCGSLLLGIRGHQFISATLLAWMTAACARRDAWAKGMALISVAFIAHCGVVILATTQSPARVEPIVAGGADYWEKQITWIETGRDPEYDPLVWIPNHVTLFVGTVVWSSFSLGLVTFQRGFHEVDLMNYYIGNLLLTSQSRPRALGLGWHVWSLLRGVGYVVLTFELVSLGLRCWSGIALSTWRRRLSRWGVGISLLLADGAVKYALLGPVRDALFENLAP